MSRDLWPVLWSRKLATILLVILILLAAVGATLPQEAVYASADFQQWLQDHPRLAPVAVRLGLTRIFTSFFFIGCSLLLCLSLLFCSLRRGYHLIGRREERVAIDHLERAPQVQTVFRSPFPVEHVATRIEILLKKKGFCCAFATTELLYAVRGRWGAVGSLAFHLSFLLLLCGALAGAWARVEGFFALGEGQSFRGLPGEYASLRTTPLAGRTTLPFLFRFEELLPGDAPQVPFATRVSLQDEQGVTTALIRPFHALSHRGYTFYQKERGFAPHLRLRDRQGVLIFDARVSFFTTLQGTTLVCQDRFAVPGTGYTIAAALYPDAVNTGTGWSTRSTRPVNPVLTLELTTDSAPAHHAALQRGETAVIGDLTVEFVDLRYWASFRVVKDAGLWLIYAGFALAILGYALRLWFVREILRVAIVHDAAGSMLIISGSTEQNPALFAEKFASLAALMGEDVARL